MTQDEKRLRSFFLSLFISSIPQFTYFLSVLPSFLLSCLLSFITSFRPFFLFFSLHQFFYHANILFLFFLPFLSSLLPSFCPFNYSFLLPFLLFLFFCLSFLLSALPHLFLCFSFPPSLLFRSFATSRWNLLSYSLSPCLHFISLSWSHRSEVNRLQTNSISQTQISVVSVKTAPPVIKLTHNHTHRMKMT